MARPSLPFPDFLAPEFSPEDLERSASSIAVVDSLGAFLWLNPAWWSFAEQNGGGDGVVGAANYSDGISPSLRDYYRALFAETLASAEVVERDYECSSPDEFRLFHLRLLPVQGRAIIAEHSLVVHHPHDVDSAAGLAASYYDANGILSMCSYCRRARVPGSDAWHWVPTLVADPDPRTSHGICPLCVGFHFGHWVRRP